MAIWRQERSASGGSAESAGTAAPAAAGGAAAAAVDDLRRQCAVAAQERAALHTILDAKVAALVADISAGLRELPEEVSVARAMPSAQRLHECTVDLFAGLREPGGGLSENLPSVQYELRRAGVCRRMQAYEFRQPFALRPAQTHGKALREACSLFWLMQAASLAFHEWQHSTDAHSTHS
jgi:hypothetical protein